MRTILEWAAQESATPGAEAERFPYWFIRMTKPGIDLDEAVAAELETVSRRSSPSCPDCETRS